MDSNPDDRRLDILDDLDEKAGEITYDEAREALGRLLDSHFRRPGKESVRISIPADVSRDDDLRLYVYLLRAEGARRRLAEEQATLADYERVAVKHGFDADSGEYDPDWYDLKLTELAAGADALELARLERDEARDELHERDKLVVILKQHGAAKDAHVDELQAWVKKLRAAMLTAGLDKDPAYHASSLGGLRG